MAIFRSSTSCVCPVFYGDGAVVNAASGTATLTETTTVPAGTIEAGSLIEVSTRGFGGTTGTPAVLTLTFGALTLAQEYTQFTGEAVTLVYRGYAPVADTLQGASLVGGTGTAGGGPLDFSIDNDLVIEVSGGASAVRGVYAPIIVIYPPAGS